MGAGVGRALRWSRDHDDSGAGVEANDDPATECTDDGVEGKVSS